jgi:hypothetical protein
MENLSMDGTANKIDETYEKTSNKSEPKKKKKKAKAPVTLTPITTRSRIAAMKANMPRK